MTHRNPLFDSPLVHSALASSALFGCIRFFDTLSPKEFLEACFYEGAEEGARVRNILRNHLGHLYDEAMVDLWICGNEVWCSFTKELPKISRENTARLKRWIYWKLSRSTR